MLFRILKSNQPIVLILFTIIFFFQWINSFIDPNTYYFLFDSHSTIFYKVINNLFIEQAIFSILLSFIFLFIQALIIVRINTKYLFLNNRTYLPALIFFLICGSYLELHRFYPVIIANLFLLLGIERLFASFKQNIALNKIFDAAFLVSLGSFFYTNLIFYIFIIWVGTIILRQFYWREWIVSIIGFICPYFLYFGYHLLAGSNITSKFHILLNNITFYNSILYMNIYYKVYLGIITFLTIISSYQMIAVFQTKKISSRKYLLIFWWLFVFSILVYLFFQAISVELIPVIAVPLSYIISHYFTQSKENKIIHALFYIFLISSLIIQKLV